MSVCMCVCMYVSPCVCSSLHRVESFTATKLKKCYWNISFFKLSYPFVSEPRAVVSSWVVNEWKEPHDPININFHSKQTKQNPNIFPHTAFHIKCNVTCLTAQLDMNSVTPLINHLWGGVGIIPEHRRRKDCGAQWHLIYWRREITAVCWGGWERPEARRNSSGDQWAARQLPVCERACAHVCACVCMCKYI